MSDTVSMVVRLAGPIALALVGLADAAYWLLGVPTLSARLGIDRRWYWLVGGLMWLVMGAAGLLATRGR